ncbi:anti sigma factor C-terminal domain-containing protein [Saccharibacillus alkalitolerans]|uniref:Sigma factor regulator C-terminal domain-containing protein n=1 Tax=Saccharibacillus alkalitolerans TaxID=2705290 RepID=A0ABX0F8J7_9BACL|nr:anti sigma factor C-terminal domain-containing protein [Saccharibacillus alkalitolerans]NGZ76230.1 hypothetical protein [Saccharibacillus alkalitolerans]
MNEDFKRRLAAYRDGTLTQTEREEVERELEKLEAYQSYLDELMDEEEHPDRLMRKEEGGGRAEEGGKKMPEDEIERMRRRKERRIIRRAKWKSRGITALVTLVVLAAVWAGSGWLSQSYYAKTGEYRGMNRQDLYQHALSRVVETTMPNRYLAFDQQEPGTFFTLGIEGLVQHPLGNTIRSEARVNLDYRFGRLEKAWVEKRDSAYNPYSKNMAGENYGKFWMPGGSERSQEEAKNAEAWKALHDLPRLTSSELYISLDREYAQQELDAKFAGMRVQPSWFAVRTGQEWSGYGTTYTLVDEHGKETKAAAEDYLNLSVQNPVGAGRGIGYEYVPRIGEKNEEFEKYQALSWSSGMVEALKEAARNPAIAEKLSGVDFAAAAKEVENNGAKVYGVVVTGRSEDLAKLRQEKWMRGAIVRLGDSVLDTGRMEPYTPDKLLPSK